MDTELLVENKIEDGAALIRQLIRDQFEVRVAFWVKRTEEGLWYLYIATPTNRTTPNAGGSDSWTSRS